MLKFLNIVKQCDMLGLNLNFHIENNKSFNTWPGVMSSLLLFSFLLYSFIQMIFDIQRGVNPIIQRSSYYLEQNEGFKFPSHGFLYTILILDSYGTHIENTQDKTYYTTQFQKRIIGQDYTTYNFGACGQWVKEYFQSQGSQLNLDETQCVNDKVFSQEGGIYLENSLVLKNFTYQEFQIYRCQNSSDFNYTCATDEEIDAKLHNAYFGYSYPQYQFDPLNYTTPFQMKVATRQITLNIKDQKTIYLSYKLSQSLTEQNIFYFFPEQKIENGIEYYETIIDQQAGIADGLIFAMNFYLDDQKIVYKRTYQNILNIFGSIGGTFSVLKIVFMIILQPLQQLLLTLTMFNRISGKQKHIKVLDYFRSSKKRLIISEYFQIIQKSMELFSYMEIMLKYENDMLTFRLDKLAEQNCDLLKSQTMANQYNFDKVNDKLKYNMDEQEQIQILSVRLQDEKLKQENQNDNRQEKQQEDHQENKQKQECKQENKKQNQFNNQSLPD